MDTNLNFDDYELVDTSVDLSLSEYSAETEVVTTPALTPTPEMQTQFIQDCIDMGILRKTNKYG